MSPKAKCAAKGAGKSSAKGSAKGAAQGAAKGAGRGSAKAAAKGRGTFRMTAAQQLTFKNVSRSRKTKEDAAADAAIAAAEAAAARSEAGGDADHELGLAVEAALGELEPGPLAELGSAAGPAAGPPAAGLPGTQPSQVPAGQSTPPTQAEPPSGSAAAAGEPRQKKPRTTAAKLPEISDKWDASESEESEVEILEAQPNTAEAPSAQLVEGGMGDLELSLGKVCGKCSLCGRPCYEKDHPLECKSKKKDGTYRDSYWKHPACAATYRVFSGAQLKLKLGEEAQQYVKDSDSSTKLAWYNMHGGMITAIAKHVTFKYEQSEIWRKTNRLKKECTPFSEAELKQKLLIDMVPPDQKRYDAIHRNAKQIWDEVQEMTWYMVPMITTCEDREIIDTSEKKRAVDQERHLKAEKQKAEPKPQEEGEPQEPKPAKAPKKKAEPKQKAEPKPKKQKKIAARYVSMMEIIQTNLEKMDGEYTLLIADLTLEAEPDSRIGNKILANARKCWEHAVARLAELPGLLELQDAFPNSPPHHEAVVGYVAQLQEDNDFFLKAFQKLKAAKHMARDEADTDDESD